MQYTVNRNEKVDLSCLEWSSTFFNRLSILIRYGKKTVRFLVYLFTIIKVNLRLKILRKFSSFIVIVTSAFVGGSPSPTCPEPVLKSM